MHHSNLFTVEIPFVIGTSGIPTLSVPRFDDGASDAIEISLQGGFPFANSYQTVVYVSVIIFPCALSMCRSKLGHFYCIEFSVNLTL